MPSYEAMVLEKFALLMRNNLIYRGSRAVFWSVENQRIMNENEIEETKEVRDCLISKFPIKSFGVKS